VIDTADAASGGLVGQRIRDLRSSGASFDDMASAMAAAGIRVSRETIRAWCLEHGVAKGSAA
jgi:hypothetical protein